MLEAENGLLSALENDPVNPDFRFELANIYAAHYDRWRERPGDERAQEFLNRAAHQLEQVVMIRPDDVPALFNLGVIYKKRREYEKARAQFKKVMILDPQSIAARMQIGAIYEEQGFFNEARDAYLEAREIDFFNPEIRSAIEDLEHAESDWIERDRQRHSQDLLFRREFRYTAFSQARTLLEDRNAQYNNQAGLAQALPYAAALLIQQFMNRGRQAGDDPT